MQSSFSGQILVKTDRAIERYLVMRPIYRSFSSSYLLNVIALGGLIISLILFWEVIHFITAHQSGISLVEYLMFSLIFVVVISANVWLLTSSLLPIVVIGKRGVMAISIFWKRRITWEAIRKAEFIKASQAFHRHGTKLRLEATRQPETHNIAIFNQGRHVTTYILLSDHNYRVNSENQLRSGFVNHRAIAGARGIAFRYDAKAWEAIQRMRTTIGNS